MRVFCAFLDFDYLWLTLNLLFLFVCVCVVLATSLNHSNGVGTTSVTNSSAGLSQVSAGLSDDGGVINGEILAHPNIKVYSYADLKTAARNFRGDMVLGVGGFGTVYKGWVDGKTLLPSRHGTGMMVAIKKLNQESTQGFDEWQVK